MRLLSEARQAGSEPVATDTVDGSRLSLILRNNELRLRLAQEAGQIGSFEIDIASNEMAVTEQFCRIYGLPIKPFIAATDVEKLIFPGDEQFLSTSKSRSDGSLALQTEYRIRRLDTGQVVWIARRARLMSDASGHPVRMVGTVQDITEKKTAKGTT